MKPEEKKIREVLARYEIPFESNVWFVQGTAVIKHMACELIAARAGITYADPIIIRAERDEAVILVKASLGEKTEWSIGEALVNVNYRVSGKQAGYVYAMSEKRAKDRAILKLVELHGVAYSEQEADEFKESHSPSPQGPAPAQPLTIAVMAVEHMLSEIELCSGDLAELETLKAEDAFRKGYRNASKADQARILAALNPKVEAAE